MTNDLVCPNCGSTIRAPDRKAGGNAACEFCYAPLPIGNGDLAGTRASSLFPQVNTLLSIAVLLAICGFLVLMLIPAFSDVRTPRTRNPCVNNLKQIALAFLNYEVQHGSFPPAYAADAQGKLLYSWRYFILPQVEELKAYRAFDPSAAWDSPANSPLLAQRMLPFHCPEDSDAQAGTTNYVVIVDPDGAFTGGKPVRIADISDGLADTVAAIEIDDAIPWSAPHDPTLDEVLVWLKDRKKLGKRHLDGVIIAFLDGHTTWIPLDEFTPELLRAMVTRAGGEEVDWPSR